METNMEQPMSPLPKKITEEQKPIIIEQSTSPLPKKVEEKKEPTITMDFFQALKEVSSGNKIHKLEWISIEYYGFLNDNILSLHKPDGKTYQWVINDGDLNGIDWIVIK